MARDSPAGLEEYTVKTVTKMGYRVKTLEWSLVAKSSLLRVVCAKKVGTSIIGLQGNEFLQHTKGA